MTNLLPSLKNRDEDGPAPSAKRYGFTVAPVSFNTCA